MTLAILHSRALVGMSALPVKVEVHLGSGLPSFTVVGLADAEVKESRDRVRAAIQSSGFDFPNGRLTVNLAPADLPKESGRFDLPIALGVLLVSGQIDLPELSRDERASEFVPTLKKYVFAGELSLTGSLVSIRGAIVIALEIARDRQILGLVLPRQSALQAADVPDAKVLAADSLRQVVDFLSGRNTLAAVAPAMHTTDCLVHPCMSDVQGQETARRALEIAATGAHSLLLIGPPGVGKSMLAHRLPGISPAMTQTERMEVTAIASYLDSTSHKVLGRPFRAPHHSASSAAVVGGGKIPKPGEITLAHHGILFLDEIPEFDRRTLEGLREPLEHRKISIARANHKVIYPADFQLVAAMNPCPCGYGGDTSGRCRCTAEQIRRYQGKLSGPLLDRIDMVIWLTRSGTTDLWGQKPEPSNAIRTRVARANQRAMSRQGCRNAQLEGKSFEGACQLDHSAQQLMKQLSARYRLSRRSFVKLQRIARTSADLDDKADISSVHIAEAFRYRVENLACFAS